MPAASPWIAGSWEAVTVHPTVGMRTVGPFQLGIFHGKKNKNKKIKKRILSGSVEAVGIGAMSTELY